MTIQTDPVSHLHITFAEARKQLTELTNRVAYKGERLIIDRHNKSMVALVSVEDLYALEAWEDECDLKEAQKRFKQTQQEGVLSRAQLEVFLKEK
jgi:prevent-host-death family protein